MSHLLLSAKAESQKAALPFAASANVFVGAWTLYMNMMGSRPDESRDGRMSTEEMGWTLDVSRSLPGGLTIARSVADIQMKHDARPRGHDVTGDRPCSIVVVMLIIELFGF